MSARNIKKSLAKACTESATPRCTGKLTPEADFTWLLHRAAQRMRVAMEQEIEQHGVQLRDYIVLTALKEPGQTQLALGNALGLDKTTMTSLLDRLEQERLVIRRAVPHDRRARMPVATDAGRALQTKIANTLARIESEVLADFSAKEQHALRAMLCHIVSTGEDSGTPISGSCV